MDDAPLFYVGRAPEDQIGGTGWFVGQFVPEGLGLRHQSDVELKWGIHPDGEKRSHPWAHGTATTISVLVQGMLHVTFPGADAPLLVTLQEPGDYVIFGPDAVHSWEAVGETIVLTVRFPSVEIGRRSPGPEAGQAVTPTSPHGLSG